MVQIGNVKEIIEVKLLLDSMKKEGLIKDWEIPYENLLTRRSAAIFFLTPADEDYCGLIWEKLGAFDNFSYKEDIEGKLSHLKYRITFSKDDNFYY